MKKKKVRIRVNDAIRIAQIRLIDENGTQVGVVDTNEARKMAADRGYDLVEVSPNSAPPVCRIMDYGKYLYELQKKAKIAKKKQHTVQLKEIRFRPKIESHDYEVKLRRIKEFLEAGYKVKILVMFRGRELAHKDLGFRVVDKLKEDIEDVGYFEVPGKMETRSIVGIVAPVSGTQEASKEQKKSE